MSKFLDVNELVIDDEPCFVATLQRDMTFLGCGEALQPVVEFNTVPQHLIGYMGDERPETAEFIVRREFVGPGANDIGFKRTETGLKPIISEFDSHFYGSTWLDLLSQRYAENKYENQMYQQGFGLTSKTANIDGTTTMEFVQIGEF